MKNIEKTEPKSQLTDREHSEHRISPFGRLSRFIGWWFGFTGFYATFAVCPFCGHQGCPVGMASAGTIGAFLALCIQDWKRFFAFLRQKLNKKEKF
jgi:4-hydroxybenzoate polyprenyltransferase